MFCMDCQAISGSSRDELLWCGAFHHRPIRETLHKYPTARSLGTLNLQSATLFVSLVTRHAEALLRP